MWNALTKYHPRIGFTMMPSVRSRVPSETGGYLVRTNAAGFRSDHEFVRERTTGKYRAILFGDSQTAGDGVSNGERYSDVVQEIVPNLEVFNYGLPGSGTDQHYLTYLDCADVDHDLLIIGMYVENIGRVASRFRPFLDASGKEVIYAKPYFTIENGTENGPEKGELVLHGVPVQKAPMTRASIPAQDAPYVDSGVPLPGLRNVVKKLGMRDLMQKITKFQPVPDYDSPENPKWLLLRRILTNWIRASQKRVLIFLVPMWPFIEQSSDPTNYQSRYRELAAEMACYVHDPLPDLWKYSMEERRAFRFKIDTHLTPKGHRAMALSLASAINHIKQAEPGDAEAGSLRQVSA